MHTQLEELIPVLESHGYTFQSINYKTSSVTVCKDSTKLIVYPTRKGYTVASCLQHPRQGRTQLIRRRVCPKELLQILSNPRVHLGKGYHLKKKTRKARRKRPHSP